jgi:hypothetical protein
LQFLDQSLRTPGAARIKQDKVELQTSAAAEFVAHHHFVNECLVPGAIYANQHDRKVTGYSLRPESRAIQAVIFLERGRLTRSRIGKDDTSSQAVKQRDLVGSEHQVAKLGLIRFQRFTESPVYRVDA